MSLRRATLSGAALLCASALCLAEGTATYQVIVNQDNPAGTLSAPELSEIFLKKTVRWPSGAAIEPVDLSGDPEVREAFSRQIHLRTTANVKSFWNQEVFSGRGVPPPELGTSRDVVQYVAAHSGAIGYVAAAATLEGVKAVGVLIPPRVVRRVEPVYPASAIAARASGDVVLSVEVDKDGAVSRVAVVKDLPFGLSREAARAVERWRFDPATVNGKPVAQSIEVTVHFAAPRE
jgi:TonB family protein